MRASVQERPSITAKCSLLSVRAAESDGRSASAPLTRAFVSVQIRAAERKGERERESFFFFFLKQCDVKSSKHFSLQAQSFIFLAAHQPGNLLSLSRTLSEGEFLYG